MKITDLSQLEVKNNHFFYNNKRIGKWWGKTLYHIDAQKTLNTYTFNLFGLFFHHVFGYKSEYKQRHLNEWLKSKNPVGESHSKSTAISSLTELKKDIETFKELCRTPSGTHGQFLERLDPNTKLDGKGTTLLHFAAQNDNHEILKYLLDKGAGPRARVDFSGIPLEYAVYHRKTENVRVLLEADKEKKIYSQKEKNDLLLLAFNANNLDLVKVLHKHGAEIDATNPKNPSTPLYLACVDGKLDSVAFLLNLGANPMFGKYTPIDVASQYNQVKIVKLILESNLIPIDKKNERLIQAASSAHWDLVKLLIEHNADVNFKPGVYSTLSMACNAGNLEMVKFLLENGATIPRIENEWTPEIKNILNEKSSK